MADNQIVLSFVGKDGGIVTVTKNVASAIDNVGKSAKTAKRSIEDLGEGWKKLSQQGGARLAASEWANKLAAAASGAAQATKQSADVQTKAAKTAGDAVTNANKRMEISFKSLIPHIRTGAAALGIYFGVKAVQNAIKNADAYQDMASRLKLVSGSTQELVTAQTALFRISQQNRTPLEETVRLYYRMATSMRDLGKSQEDTLKIVDLVGKAMKISGASATESAAGLQQLGQALGAGQLNGDEFRSVLENMPRVAKALTESLGVNIGTLREMSAQGKLTSETVVNALMKASDSINSEFKQIPTTVSGAWTQLSNAVLKYIGDADTAKGTTHELATAISSLAENVNVVLDPIAKFFTLEAEGWAKILEGVKQYRIALGDLNAYKEQFGVNQALTTQEWNSRRQANPNPETMGPTYFKKVENGALEAALATKKLSDSQKEVARIVFDEANKNGVSAAWALAVAQVESDFTQIKKSGELLTSDKGAVGVMQLMAGTANRFKVESKDTRDNIKGGIEYLKTLYKMFDKNTTLATAGYNAGEGNVMKYGNTVPPFNETKKYVDKVTVAFKEYSDALGVVNSEMETAEQTSKRLADDQKLLNSAQQDGIAAAEAKAKVDTETNKTLLDGISNRIKAIQDEAKTQVDGLKVWDDRQAVIRASEEAVRQELEKATDIGREQIAIEEELIQKRIQALQQSLDGNQTYLEEQDIKRSIGDLEADLATKAQQRIQLEQDAGQKAQDAGRASLDMKLKEKEFIEKINSDLEFQKKLYEQLQAAQANGATTDQLKLINDIATATRTLPDNISQGQIPALAEQIKLYEELKNKTDDLVKSEEKVREEQLRMNAYWDQTLSRIKEYASLMKQISGDQKNAWGDMAVGAMEYAKSVDQITQKYSDLQTKWREKNGASANQTDGFLAMQEALEQGQAAAAMLAKTMLVARDNTEKGSQAYKNLTTSAGNFMAIVQLLNVAEGISAIIKQLDEGDPYTAAIRAAGTAMLLASMSVNTGFGSGTPSVTKDINTTGTNGGVFGGKSDEISNSIADSLKMIEDHTSNNLNYSAAMLKSLQSIETALAGVTNQVVRNIAPSAARSVGTLKTGNDIFAFGMKGFDPIADALFSLVFNVTRKITAYGIQGVQQTLDGILSKGFKGMTFTDFETTTKAFFMTVSQKTETVYDKLNKDVARQFTLVFKGIGDAMKAGGESFGMSAQETMNKIGKVKLNIGKIDLAGLSGKEIQEKLSQAFSRLTDKLAKQLMPSLDDFLQVGESYSKTFFRVAEGINRAKGEMEQLGLTAIKYTDIQNKQGDVAAEIVRQTLIGQTALTSGTRKYVSELIGSAEDIIAAYQKLVQASQLMKMGGLNSGNLDRTMINAAGGLDAFVNAVKTFNDKFLLEGERLGGEAAILSDQFINLGQVMPTSSEAFRALVTGIDTSTDAGKKLFGQIISLSDSFGTLQEKIKATQDKYATILNPMSAIKTQIDTVITDFNGLIAASAAQIKSTGPFVQDIKNLTKSQLDATISQEDWMKKKLEKQKQIDDLEQQLADTIEKTPGKKKVIASLKETILQAKIDMLGIDTAVGGFAMVIADYDQQIKDAVDANNQALADSLNADKAKKLQQMGDVLVNSLESFWKSLMDGVQNLQKGLASQIATLQGPEAVAGLAQDRVNSTQGAITSYIGSLSTGRTRNISTEIQLIQDAQSAVMDRYNAEMALLQQAAQEQAAVIQENLQVQIEAINAETEARVQAINDSTDAQVQAINDTLDATLTAKQKEHEIALKGLQDQLEAANKLKSAIKGIQDYAKSMLLGSNSTLSPEKKLQEAQAQYQALLAKANAGDADAMAQLSGASDTYLQAAKEYYGSGTQYSNIFDGVKQAMDQLSAMDAPDPDSIQSHIDALRESQAEELKNIREAAQEQIKQVQTAAKDQIKAIQEAAKAQIEALQKDVAQQIKDLSDPNKNAAMLALKQDTINKLEELRKLADKTQEEANRQAVAAYELAKSEYDFSKKQTEYLFKIAEQMGIKGVTPYATGGSAQAGLALVGEKGPELVNFERPAQVMTAEQTRSALNGDEETKKFLSDIKDELKALVTTQSAANPQLVEKLTGMESRLSKMERNQRLSA